MPKSADHQSRIERQLEFDASLHSADAIQRAAYKLSDRLTCELTSAGSAFRCTLHIPNAPDADIEHVLGDFRNEVLDQVLRERIRGETKEVRNLILALAFSNTGLIEDTPTDVNVEVQDN